MKNLASVKLQLLDLNERMDVLRERSYHPDISTSELREINKRKKKLQKTKEKLQKKLEQFKFDPDYNTLD